jgi:large subunit ribosomal protein L30
MAKKKQAKIRVKLVRSMNGRLENHKACVRGLGLRRINHIRELEDTPEVRGMIRKVSYMVECEEVK